MWHQGEKSTPQNADYELEQGTETEGRPADLKEPLGFLLTHQTSPDASVERNEAPNGKCRFLVLPSSEAKHLCLVLLETQHSSSFQEIWPISPQSAIMGSILFSLCLAYSRVSIFWGIGDLSIKGFQ